MSVENRFQLKRDYIVEQLRTAIAKGELLPGQKLRQEELAARFQISSTPVREALRKLEAEGLVTSIPHQGVFVSRVDPAEMEERYKIRAMLETYALREAMARLKNAPDRLEQLLNDLEEYHAAMDEAIREARSGDIIQLNYDLHLCIYEEAKMPLLKQMIQDLWKHFPFSALWYVPGRAAQSRDEHAELFQAIRHKNSDLAGQLLQSHIENSGQVFLDYLRAREADSKA